MNHLLCFGCGYSSTKTAQKLLQTPNWKVTGTTRSTDSRHQLEVNGIKGILWPGENLDKALRTSTHWLVSIPPKHGKDIVIEYLEQVPVDQIYNLGWIGYFSTTAVYGDHGGNWVDESTPVMPTTQRGEYRVKAEKAWMNFANLIGVPLYIFRLAGIYGPGRGPLEQLRKGRRQKIVKPDQYFNRIHVEDIVGVVIKAIANPSSNGIYNLCDNLPERSDKVINYAADLLGQPIPQGIKFKDADISEMARSFYSESKKVRNHRLRTNLGYQLKYPDYKKGLSMQLNAKKINL